MSIKSLFYKTAKETGKVLTSEKALNFAKETIKETATDSIKTAGIYLLISIISIIVGLGALIYFISLLFR